ncbi:hypothetical protein JCM10908_007353 [Rhodotorula pacifica]|uniref:uncharacterized protein n=1 Tax=Rhodotorula pacifica TaxID=1495444 RepID=UPI0031746E2D
MATAIPAAPTDLSHQPQPQPHHHRPEPTTSSSSSGSLLTRVKRKISTCKSNSNNSNSNSSSNSSLTSLGRQWLKGGGGGGGDASSASGTGTGYTDEPRPYSNYTIAPPDHRENTALHAVMDSLPSLSIGSLHAPHLPSFPFSFRGFGNNSNGPGEYDDSEEDDEEEGDGDDTPPPVQGRPSPSSRRPSGSNPSLSPPLSAPRFTRRSSDPKSSSSSSSTAADPIERLYGNVVMLGGYRGSVLRDAKTHKRLWIPLKVGFGFRKADLGLGLEDEDELRSAERVIATSMLAQVGGWIDLGKKLKERLKQVSSSQLHPTSYLSFPFSSPPPSPPASDPLRPPLRFHSWGYDWRRSLELSSAELVRFLERLKHESASRGEGPDGLGLGATIIAHSMGGLVVLHALARATDPSIIRGIVFAGTPWQGCVNTLGPLKLGGGVAFNAKVGSPEICFSWRSGFYFLPRPPAEVAAITPRASLDAEQVVERSGSTGEEGEEEARQSSPVRTNGIASIVRTTSNEPQHAWTTEEVSTAPQDVTLPPSSPTSMPLPSLLTGCFEDPSGNPIPVDLFSPQSWATHELSPVPAGMDFTHPNSPIKKRPRQRRNTSGGGERGNAFPLAAGFGNLGERDSPLGDAVQDAMEGAAETFEAIRPDDHEDEEEGGAARTAYGQENGEWTAEQRDKEEERLAQQAQEVDTVHRYLKDTLGRARKFQRELIDLYDPAKADRYPPMTIITSRKTPTVRGILVTSKEDIAREGYERLLWAEGDGIVLYESAARLPGDPELEGRKRTGEPANDRWHAHLRGVVETHHGHVGMLGDLDAVRKCFELLYGPATSRH